MSRFVDLANEMLADEVNERLDWLTVVAAGETAPTKRDVRCQREQLAKFVAAWKALLAEHAPNERGRCPRCDTWLGLRHVKWPCGLWRAAHNRLITDPASRLRLPQ